MNFSFKAIKIGRIDIILSEMSDFSRSMIQKLIHAEKISSNSKIIKKANYTTCIDEVFTIIPFEANIKNIIPQKSDLEILFEDEEIIVINKNAETITHPGAGNFDNTLVNHLAYHCNLSNINGPEKLGVVHRLDKGVSGCIIFAKNNKTHTYISEQFQNRTVKKKYTAISHGKQADSKSYVENYIARSKFHRKKMAIQNSGKLATMSYEIKNFFNYQDQIFSLIECSPETGRMHQIRVQLAFQKLPIINDKVYSNKVFKFAESILQNRIALHASEITFSHPIIGKITIKAPLPEEMKTLITYFSTPNKLS